MRVNDEAEPVGAIGERGKEIEHAEDRLMVNVNIDVEGHVKPHLKKCTNELNDKLIETCMDEFKKAEIMQQIKPEHVRLIKSVIYAYEYNLKEPESNDIKEF